MVKSEMNIGIFGYKDDEVSHFATWKAVCSRDGLYKENSKTNKSLVYILVMLYTIQ